MLIGSVNSTNTDNSKHATVHTGSIGGQVNLQGDHVTQTQSSLPARDLELLSAIRSEIAKIGEAGERKDAEENADKLQQALTAKDHGRTARILGWLPDAVRVAAGVVDAARRLGLL